jgi:hypothetical protein
LDISIRICVREIDAVSAILRFIRGSLAVADLVLDLESWRCSHASILQWFNDRDSLDAISMLFDEVFTPFSERRDRNRDWYLFAFSAPSAEGAFPSHDDPIGFASFHGGSPIHDL